MGGGALEASKLIRKFVQTTKMPTVLTLMALGILRKDDEHNLGMVGMHGKYAANMAMSEIEMTSLVERVFRLENINTCPHGRPIVISMTKTEIEKQFRRIV